MPSDRYWIAPTRANMHASLNVARCSPNFKVGRRRRFLRALHLELRGGVVGPEPTLAGGFDGEHATQAQLLVPSHLSSRRRVFDEVSCRISSRRRAPREACESLD